MGHLMRLFRRLRNVIRSGRDEGGLDREIASHLLLLEDEYPPARTAGGRGSPRGAARAWRSRADQGAPS